MASSVHSEQEAFIREYLTAVSNGATGDALARFYTPDAVQDEFPNRLIPQGARRDLAGILEAAERGKAIVSTQSFEILHALWSEQEHQAALELQWQATFKIPLGSLAAGEVMAIELVRWREEPRALTLAETDFLSRKISRRRGSLKLHP